MAVRDSRPSLRARRAGARGGGLVERRRNDSRVVPNLITGAPPGDLFIVRNVGNVVPRLALPGGTAAAIEYATEVLEVKEIIVCGHTQCGAIDAVLAPETMDSLPMVKRWLAETSKVRELVEERYAHLSPAAKAVVAVEENVLAQDVSGNELGESRASQDPIAPG
jgi:carbonic anhydrase